MNIIILTPGAGAMYCGNCLRDNALVHTLRRMGHDVVMVPLYLPLTLDEPDESSQAPVFYSGINVYLEQKLNWFQRAPKWLRHILASRGLLRLAAGKAGSTRPSELGEMTLSMLKGQEGRQAREMEDLAGWLRHQPPPDVICLSNALLLGMAAGLKAAFPVPLLCYLQGEDWFLDALPEPHRTEAWKHLSSISRKVDRFVAPSHYFGGVMTRRLGLDPGRVSVVPNGIRLDGYPSAPESSAAASTAPSDAATPGSAQASDEAAPVIGYFARQCYEKGLDTLVEAFIQLCRRGRAPRCQLKVGGSCGPSDQVFVDGLRQRLQAEGLLDRVTFHPNLDRAAKLEFLRSLTLFSVPARYGEAFGLYVVEALAAGVPVVQPRVAAFAELVETSGAGSLCAPEDPQALAEALEALLLDHELRRQFRQNALRSAREHFDAQVMANRTMEVFQELVSSQRSGTDLRAADRSA